MRAPWYDDSPETPQEKARRRKQRWRSKNREKHNEAVRQYYLRDDIRQEHAEYMRDYRRRTNRVRVSEAEEWLRR
jgi:hypothetical protein